MDYLNQILKRAEVDAYEAACELGVGLMRGNSAELQLGYTWQNAAQAAADLLERNGHRLSLDERNMLDADLEGVAKAWAEIPPEELHKSGLYPSL